MNRLTPFVSLIAVLCACSSPPPPPAPEVLATLATCNLPPGVHLIGSLDALARALYGNRLPTPGTSGPVPGGFRAVVVVGGERPSSGYALNLDGADYAAGTLTLRVTESAPSEDAMVATVVTQPCLAIGVPQAGYDSLVVRQGEQTLATIPVADKGRAR